ncbi:MAG: glycosyltransferase family 4 protein [Planctomycetota bacterium]|jgi:glycosyltransferase involved in cell wall biosynthesis|nr:glycosyltransferase family 4 protein [Planctomycetota bacterium]
MTARKLVVVHFAVSGGGVKRHVLEIAAGFDRGKFDLIGIFPDAAMAASVARSGDARYLAAFKKLGLPARALEVPRWFSPWADCKSVFQLAGMLRRMKPDILHCHSSKAGLVGRLAAALAGTPAVCYTPHNMYYAIQRGMKRQVFLLAEQALALFSDAIIAVSDSEDREFRRDLWCKKKIVRIDNGIKPYSGKWEVAEVRRRYGLEPGARVILTPARCEPQKDVRTLVLAMERVVRDVPEAVLLVAGEGEQRPELEALTDRLGLRERVRFLGWVDAIEPLMAASDIVVLSSLREGLPYAVLEASDMGKPTIGSDVAGTRDCIRDGETGFLLAPGDVDGFADRMILLCGRPEACAVMGAKGREMVEAEFGAGRMLRELEALYARLAGREG